MVGFGWVLEPWTERETMCDGTVCVMGLRAGAGAGAGAVTLRSAGPLVLTTTLPLPVTTLTDVGAGLRSPMTSMPMSEPGGRDLGVGGRTGAGSSIRRAELPGASLVAGAVWP